MCSDLIYAMRDMHLKGAEWVPQSWVGPWGQVGCTRAGVPGLWKARDSGEEEELSHELGPYPGWMCGKCFS